MRVTCDFDTKNPFMVAIAFIKGLLLLHKIPYYFRMTRKGFHIAWRGLDINEKKMYRYRYLIGDDRNRIWLDMIDDWRAKQVLFTEKEVWKHQFADNQLIRTRIG